MATFACWATLAVHNSVPAASSTVTGTSPAPGSLPVTADTCGGANNTCFSSPSDSTPSGTIRSAASPGEVTSEKAAGRSPITTVDPR
jgi:hypothetical protein